MRQSTPSDEQTVLIVRRHWWLPARALFPLLIAGALLPLYAACEVLAPAADLSRFEGLFLTCVLALCGALLLKWLLADLAPWWTEPCVITTRRVICYRGVWVRERREAALSGIGDISCAIPSAQERFFQFGNLTIQPVGKRSPLVFEAIPGPRKVQALLASQARAARQDSGGSRSDGGAIGAALGRIFQGTPGTAGNPTLAIGRITANAARAQRRLALLPGEVVISADRRHGVALTGRLAAPIALVVGLGLAIWWLSFPFPWSYALVVGAGPAIWAVWAVYDWRALLQVLTTHRMLEMRCSLVDRAVPRAVSLHTIEDVLLRQVTLVGRLWRVGALVILASGGDRPLRLHAVADPEALQRRLLDAVEAARRLSHLQEQERLASTLTEWFEEYHRLQLQS